MTIPNILRQTPAPLSLTSAAPGAYRSLDGVAVVSAIAASEHPGSAAKHLRQLLARGPKLPASSSSNDQEQGQVQPAKALTVAYIVDKAAETLERLRSDKKPLIHHITVSPCIVGDPNPPLLRWVTARCPSVRTKSS